MQPGLNIPPPLLTFDREENKAPIDLEKILTGRLLVSATSGGGKSHLLRWFVEQLCKRIPIMLVDREGEYGTLTEVHEFVRAGKATDESEVDVEVTADNAATVARRLQAAGASVILDLLEYDDEERDAVVSGWFRGLMTVPRHLWRRTLVIVDEAHELAPEGGQKTQAAGEIRALAKRGRKRGYGLAILTQRLADLSKSIADCQNRLIGPTYEDVDLARSGKALGWKPERHGELKQLDPGVFYAMGPAFGGHHGAERVTTGPVRTKAPQAGAIAPPATAAEIAAALKEIAVATAEEELETKEALRKEVQRLEAELVDARKPDPEAVERAAERLAAPLKAAIAALELRVARLRHHATAMFLDEGETPPEVTTTAAAVNADPVMGYPITEEPVNSDAIVITVEPEEHPDAAAIRAKVGDLGPDVSSRMVTILGHSDRNVWTREDLAAAAGTKATSSVFRSALANAKRLGAAVVEDGRIVVPEIFKEDAEILGDRVEEPVEYKHPIYGKISDYPPADDFAEIFTDRKSLDETPIAGDFRKVKPGLARLKKIKAILDDHVQDELPKCRVRYDEVRRQILDGTYHEYARDKEATDLQKICAIGLAANHLRWANTIIALARQELELEAST